MTQIRLIRPEDNRALATIIRNSLKEFGAAHPGTVYFDPSTDSLFELFEQPNAFYNVAESDGVVLGGGGIFPTDGLPEGTCELVKMYLHPDARGKGLGKLLIMRSIEQAKANGFSQIYLESMPELKKALEVYEHLGFKYLKGPIGNSGHTGCSLWMILELT